MDNESIEKLKFDEHNFNLHTEEGLQLLEKSINENKFGRSILLDKDNNIIAGNGVVESAKKLGHKKVRIIETEGDELIAVKRKDLSIDSKEGRSLALADNAVANVDLKWNDEELKQAEAEWGVVPEDWGVKIKEIKQNDLSNDVELDFAIQVNLDSEEEQQQLYEELQERGYECQVLTL